MADAKIALLPDRGVVAVRGADAAKLLQGVVTNDMDHLAARPAMHAGLLSPQGKILFEFFVVRVAGGFLLETQRDKAGELAKRLAMYKLRANAEIADVSQNHTVAVGWGAPIAPEGSAVAYADPRHDGLGTRLILSMTSDGLPSHSAASPASADDYHAHRIALGVPEGGRDYELGDTFPHEALFDRLGGVSFTKGCYVGQEVVARMQHKTAVRKRVTPLTGARLVTGSDVLAGEVAIGRVGSVAGERALALVRLDRVAEAQDKGQPLTAGGAPVTFDSSEIDAYRRAAAARGATP